jgi:hypothetical protein
MPSCLLSVPGIGSASLPQPYPLSSVESNDCYCALLYSVNLTEGIFYFVHGQSNFIVVPCIISWQIRPVSLIDGSKDAQPHTAFLQNPIICLRTPTEHEIDQSQPDVES